MVTYTLLASLTVTSFFSMPVTRFVADQLYEERAERVLPSVAGACAVQLALGFNDLMHGCLRTLCAGYGLYAVGNTVLLILLYFTDYKGALGAAAAFAVLAGGGTALSLRFDPAFYGFGFLAGAAVLFLAALLRLDWFTRNLPYRILGQQPLAAAEEKDKEA